MFKSSGEANMPFPFFMLLLCDRRKVADCDKSARETIRVIIEAGGPGITSCPFPGVISSPLILTESSSSAMMNLDCIMLMDTEKKNTENAISMEKIRGFELLDIKQHRTTFVLRTSTSFLIDDDVSGDLQKKNLKRKEQNSFCSKRNDG